MVPMSQNSKINKTLLSDKRIPKSLPFTTSSSSFYSGTGTILSGMNFVCDLELVLDLNLSRSIQQAAVPIGMLCLHGKCCFRASYRYKDKKGDNLHGDAECPGPCCILSAGTLEGLATHCWCAGVMLQPLWWPLAPLWQAKATGQCSALPLPACVLDRSLLRPKASWQNSFLPTLLRSLMMALP